MGSHIEKRLSIGWAQTNITPEKPVLIRGYSYVRVSEGVQDDLTATALILESSGSVSVMVSCDLIVITDELRDQVRQKVQQALPEIDSQKVVLNATHTHNGPELRPELAPGALTGFPLDRLGAMDPVEYVDFASGRIADAVVRAWEQRQPGGVSWGLGHAVISQNRLASYYGSVTGDKAAEGAPAASSSPFSTGAVRQSPGSYSKMYGKTDDPDFSHLEGYVDHSLDVLFTWDANSRLTGVVMNLACPSQVGGNAFYISADFWKETRDELRKRFGAELYVLPQCSPAGDQNSVHLYRQAAEQRMLELKGRSRREEIAMRLSNAVEELMPWMDQVIEWDPILVHEVHSIELPRRPVTDEEAQQARQEAGRLEANFNRAVQQLTENPNYKDNPRWYVEPSKAYWLWNRAKNVMARYEEQQSETTHATEVHVIRLGDVAFATNPFEYYLDYGIQIQARSKAVQTFLVQLAGPGTYVPTQRAVEGGAYGAVSASNIVGPEGGRELANRTVELIGSLWTESQEA